ncbi:MAG: flagellar hook-basal body complex protein FliE [Deltaproteobacteria bacterium]|jgi:flagellar hook-basal body complex protein FliE|nr:flagellar hook-basal body complex protein FliE [Deltaproteobacteria bacterium]
MNNITGVYNSTGRLIKDAAPVSAIPKITGDVQQVGQQSFADMLAEQINKVNAEGITADDKMANYLVGKEADPHSAILALQKADISFQLLTSVRDKVIQAYQEVMRTQL